MTHTISTTIGTLVSLTTAAYNPTTITSTGLLTDGLYVSFTGLAVVNAGSITANAVGFGIELLTAGSVTNQSGGAIGSRDEGIFGYGGAVTVVNAGSIAGAGDGGIVLSAGGSVTNQSGGAISGGINGIQGLNAAVTVVNAGGITASGYGVFLNAGGRVTNQSGGAIGSRDEGIYGLNAAVTVVNAGGITASNDGVFLLAGGSVTNQRGGAISGVNGIVGAGGAVTVVNAGTITGSSDAVKFAAGFANRLVIDPGAVFSGTVTGGNAIGAAQVSTLELASGASAGTLSGLGTKYVDFAQVTVDAGAQWTLTGATTLAAGYTLTDAGTLTNAGPLSVDSALTLAPGGVLSNASTGTITASDGNAVYGAAGGAATVVNAGVIADDGDGIVLDAGGRVTNQSGGAISGGDGIYGKNATATVVNAGGITASGYGVFLDAGGSVTNQSGGTISGGDGIYGKNATATVVNAGGITASGYGVFLDKGGSVTNQSGGAIRGGDGIYGKNATATVVNAGGITASGYGVFLLSGGRITNQSSGTISGGVNGIVGENAAVTVVNAGTIAGSTDAVQFAASYANRLVIDPGAVFVGTVTGGNAIGAGQVSTLELASGASAGTLSGLGTKYVDFAQVTVDAGAHFTLAGANTIEAGVTMTNAGTLSGTVTLAAGGVFSNASTGKITVSSGNAVDGARGGAATVVNAGVITGGNASSSNGLYLLSGGRVTNQSGGAISGFLGIFGYGGAATVVNVGSIAGNATNGEGILLTEGGGVTNQSGGAISGYDGIFGENAALTVVNAGSIAGNATNGEGILLTEGGGVTNQSGGAISGYDGIFGENAALTVVNAGSIAGNATNGEGILLIGGGGVTNHSGGAISGGDGIHGEGGAVTVVNAGSIAASDGIGVELVDGGSVTNQNGGAISGNGGIYGNGGAVTVVNAGSIAGANGFGINLRDGGSVTNQSGGSISNVDGVVGGNAAVTVVNAGTIAGSSYAVKFAVGSANRLIADPGAVFTGNVEGGGGVLELASAASAGTLSGLGTGITNFSALQFDAGAAWTVSGNDSASGLGTIGITGFADGDTIDLTGFLADSETFSNNTLVLTDTGGAQDTLSIQGTFTSGSFQLSADASRNGTDIVVVCFCAGTMIGTPDGEVPVEKLNIGDRVLTAHNGPRAVTWIGHGKVLATRGRRTAATPVIVRKGALAGNVPKADLRVTKAHSLYIDDVLIPVEFLVNHRTILWDDHAGEVEIYHVELDSHDVLLANGAPAESYRDDGNRWLFHNANECWHLPPQDPYAPVLTGGPIVDAIWQRLLDRAPARPAPTPTEDPDLHLLVDGARIDPAGQRGTALIFRLPTRPHTVRIVSRAASPAELGLTRDPRRLGVAVTRIAVGKGMRLRTMEASDATLTDGFHNFEPALDLRWTDGDAALPGALFEDFDGAMTLILHVGGATRYPAFAQAVSQVTA